MRQTKLGLGNASGEGWSPPTTMIWPSRKGSSDTSDPALIEIMQRRPPMKSPPWRCSSRTGKKGPRWAEPSWCEGKGAACRQALDVGLTDVCCPPLGDGRLPTQS